MQNLKELTEKKNEIKKEVKEMKKERLLYTFLNILKPSYPANLAAGAQLCGYLGIIIGIISLATGSYLGSLPATLAILGSSAAFAIAMTVAAYICYDKKEYLAEKIKELKEIDDDINNFDNVIGKSNSKENIDVKSTSKNNITEESKTISDKISELREYKEKVINDNQPQMQDQINKKK